MFAKHDREAMIEMLNTAKIAFGRLSDLDDFVAHPQNNWLVVEAGDTEIEILAPAAVVAGEVPNFGAVPRLDEHGDRLRDEFG